MKDIDFYTMVRFNTLIHPAFTEENIITLASKHLGFPVSSSLLEKYLQEVTPKTKVLAHALSSLGFTQPEISKLIGVAQGSISTHLNKPLDMEWKDIFFKRFERQNTIAFQK